MNSKDTFSLLEKIFLHLFHLPQDQSHIQSSLSTCRDWVQDLPQMPKSADAQISSITGIVQDPTLVESAGSEQADRED